MTMSMLTLRTNPTSMKQILLPVFLTILTLQSYAQDAPAQTTPEQNVEEPKKEKKEKKEKKAAEVKTETVAASPAEAPKEEQKIASQSKGPKPKVPYHFMANVHGGIGLMNYLGDVRDRSNTTVHRVGNRAGYNFGIGGNVTNYLEVNVDVLMGKLNGNENNYGEHRNFEAKVFTAGASLTYNFKNFIRDPKGITPFISVGVSYSDYNLYADLQDGDGNVYYYWDDGLIRNVDQSSPATDDIKIIERDYKYETRLNEFPITAVAIPIGAGIDFNASRKFAVRLGAHYYFTTSDKIDNYANTGGLLQNDGFFYTSMSVYYRFDPFKKKAPKVETDGELYSGLGEIEEADSDGDGVSDFFDRCAATPKGLPVDANGCPADDDKDGIPNYKDKQLNTPSGSVVDPNGVAISYEDIYKTYGTDTVTLARKNVTQDWLFSQPDNSKYTVHVGTYTNYDIPTQLKMRLAKMEGLVERKINDSVSVFTLGLFDDFAAAEKKQNELIKSGIDDAFGVRQNSVANVAENLKEIKVETDKGTRKALPLEFENKPTLAYGVEIREYRLRIELDRLSKLIAQHGVEMKTTTGGMKVYTIGAFKTLAEAQALEKEVVSMGVKNPAITAKYNNQPIELEKAREIEAGGN